MEEIKPINIITYFKLRVNQNLIKDGAVIQQL